MKRITLVNEVAKLIGILMLCTSFFYSCSPSEEVVPNNGQTGGQQQNGNTSGDVAPDFELTALDGSSFKLSDYKDKIVVLFFFGSSCPSCRAVAPSIEDDLNIAYSSKNDYIILGLDVWDGRSNSVESFKSLTKVSFPLLLDASSVGSSYKTTYDRLLVIDKKGKIAFNGSRSAANDLKTVAATVDDLFKNM